MYGHLHDALDIIIYYIYVNQYYLMAIFIFITIIIFEC